MKIIGVTGPIGSGKSTLSDYFAKKGAKVIDADLIYREVVHKGKPALTEIVRVFGNEVLDGEGQLDRKKLASIVFNDKVKLEVLNGLTHKYIIEEIIEEIKKARESHVEVLVIECPIPIKHGFIDLVDEVYVVVADEKVRAERIMKRNNLSFDDALKRIRSQMTNDEYISIADKVIRNESDFDSLIAQLEGNI
ncbi:Dephospho-CoA kinase [Pseudobacteroides cellulosolvens ATCC 35603 = DSM 2933]|uniref:Dephospho-CoA kinase n=1 Tax=Pseudobacteroides cellulosolvens ATCC 35603 = DSM 2933 TaxID=398512 RepID=A0A0L6JHN2_9FIRM|nr:dephospho-CoA kinase [Pseudobacteroides cellulosolvens]KNY25224.1 Dephospho-CoA kinase [Pseudobacteroides cellulosolvens ATCC 35603 = DSM 2933]